MKKDAIMQAASMAVHNMRSWRLASPAAGNEVSELSAIRNQHAASPRSWSRMWILASSMHARRATVFGAGRVFDSTFCKMHMSRVSRASHKRPRRTSALLQTNLQACRWSLH